MSIKLSLKLWMLYTMISRINNAKRFLHKKINSLSEKFSIVCLIGPRQVGKKTLAKAFAELNSSKYSQITIFDLEDPEDLAALTNPKLILSKLSGLIIIDEIQLKPELFPILRVLADDNDLKIKQQWLILGSASRELLHHSSETLAGRIAYLEIKPFSLQEININQKNDLWERGGLPLSFLANSDIASATWRKQYIKTFLEQDIQNLGIKIAPGNLRRFWMMVAHYHGNILNINELSRSLGINNKSIKYYIDILTDTFMLRQLQPWWENISKRQVKSPKIYIRDPGILHYLLNIENHINLIKHPKMGASWEGFALEQIINYYDIENEKCFFWSTHANAELDLLLFHDGKRLGFKFKFSDTPKITKSIRIALEDLKLDNIRIIYPGTKSYYLDEKIKVESINDYSNIIY